MSFQYKQLFQPPQLNLEKYNITLPDLPKDSSNEARVNDITVRGRIFDQTKPVTFNQVDVNLNFFLSNRKS